MNQMPHVYSLNGTLEDCSVKVPAAISRKVTKTGIMRGREL